RWRRCIRGEVVGVFGCVRCFFDELYSAEGRVFFDAEAQSSRRKNAENTRNILAIRPWELTRVRSALRRRRALSTGLRCGAAFAVLVFSALFSASLRLCVKRAATPPR